MFSLILRLSISYLQNIFRLPHHHIFCFLGYTHAWSSSVVASQWSTDHWLSVRSERLAATDLVQGWQTQVLWWPTQFYNNFSELGEQSEKQQGAMRSVASGRIQPPPPKQLSWASISCFLMETFWSRSSDEARLAYASSLWRPNVLRLTTAGFFISLQVSLAHSSIKPLPGRKKNFSHLLVSLSRL